jgi:hypothetical protein
MMKTIQLALGALTVLAFAGCTHPVKLGEDTGVSFRLAIQNQTYDADAARNLRPVTGLDGVTAGIVMDEYRKGFEKGESGGTTEPSGVTATTKVSVVGAMLGGQTGGR